MDIIYRDKVKQAVWVCHSLFNRNKTSGSSANISFIHNNIMYISASGSCFGTIRENQFAAMDLNGNILNDNKPSKEWPLHLKMYIKKPDTGAVIHTHGTYSVLWSFVPDIDDDDCIPSHTPYLKMKLGNVCTVPYEMPGSQALFDAFDSRIMAGDGYLLKQHGSLVPGKDIMDAFYILEELEESAKIAYLLHSTGIS